MTVLDQDRIDFTMMYVTHHAFQRDLDRLMAAAAAGKGGSSAVLDGWENFKTQLQVHHSVEDTNLWPALRSAVVGRSGDIALIDEMEAEHAQLAALLAGVDESLKGPSGALVTAAQKLSVCLVGHLGHEEHEALPLMQTVLAPADWEAFTDQMRRRQGVKGAAVYVPWALDGAPTAERRQFLAALPAAVRMINCLLWEPRYKRQARWNLS